MSKHLILASALCLGASACSSSVSVRSLEPARVALGGVRHLVILDGEGRRSAREEVYLELIAQARAGGYFTAEDLSEAGYSVRVAGRGVTVEGGEISFGPEAAGLRIDVLEWSSFRDFEEEQHTDDLGNPVYVQIPVHVGQVLLSVTLFDDYGQATLAETEYEGFWATREMTMPGDAVIGCAAQFAVSQFLADVTPFEVTSRVKLDEDDPDQEWIIQTAKAGNVGQAVRDMQTFLDRHPNNAIAAYNLAVLLEATGAFEEALAAYDRALSLGGKDYYSASRANCARRLASAEALEPMT